MEAMDVDTMARGKRMLQLRLMLSQDTTPEVMDMEVMVAMDVATMARGKLAMVVMDMVVMAVHMEVMVDMDIAVKFVPLFIISPPPSLIFLLVLRQKHE